MIKACLVIIDSTCSNMYVHMHNVKMFKYATVESGNLLKHHAKYIVHQTNCVSKGSRGLASELFRKYPYSNTYLGRRDPSSPGTIDVLGDGKEKRFIVNLYGQYYPKESKYLNDTKMKRLEWFQQGLNQLKKIPDLESVAFPYGIGCGLAGGDWTSYAKCIDEFAKELQDRVKVYVCIY